MKNKRYTCWKSGRILPLVALSMLCATAFAHNCSEPPYGDSDHAYKVYVRDTQPITVQLGPKFLPSNVLPMLCRAKFDGIGRKPLYNLGFTPDDFARKSVTDLAVQWLIALKRLADSLPSG